MKTNYTAIDYKYRRVWKEVLGIARAMYYVPESRSVELKKELEEAKVKRDALIAMRARLPIA